MSIIWAFEMKIHFLLYINMFIYIEWRFFCVVCLFFCCLIVWHITAAALMPLILTSPPHPLHTHTQSHPANPLEAEEHRGLPISGCPKTTGQSRPCTAAGPRTLVMFISACSDPTHAGHCFLSSLLTTVTARWSVCVCVYVCVWGGGRSGVVTITMSVEW